MPSTCLKRKQTRHSLHFVFTLHLHFTYLYVEKRLGMSNANSFLPIISGQKKTYCAVFWASPVALIAGSSNNTSCNGLQWLERVADCTKVREDVVRPLIYLISWASMKCFRHFTVKKTRPPLLLKGSLAYIFSGWLITEKSVKRVCGKIVFVTKFLVYRGGIKGSPALYPPRVMAISK